MDLLYRNILKSSIASSIDEKSTEYSSPPAAISTRQWATIADAMTKNTTLLNETLVRKPVL